MTLPASLLDQLRRVRLLALDVDGGVDYRARLPHG